MFVAVKYVGLCKFLFVIDRLNSDEDLSNSTFLQKKKTIRKFQCKFMFFFHERKIFLNSKIKF